MLRVCRKPPPWNASACAPLTTLAKYVSSSPTDEGVFLETQTVKDLPLATDAQIYLDLQKTGLRGPDQANALRHWEGFCRP